MRFHPFAMITLKASLGGRRVPGPSVLELDGPLFMPASATVSGNGLQRQGMRGHGIARQPQHLTG